MIDNQYPSNGSDDTNGTGQNGKENTPAHPAGSSPYPALSPPGHVAGDQSSHRNGQFAPHSSSVATRAESVVLTRPGNKAAPEEEDAFLGTLVQAAWQRKWTILSCMMIGLIAGVVYLSRVTPDYQSTATVYMDQAQPKVFGDSYGALTSEQSLSTQVQLLKSTSMLTRALGVPTMSEADEVMAQQNPIGFLRSRLSIAADGSADDILHVSMRSPAAQDNAIAVNALVQAFAEYHNERRRSTAAEVLKVLQNESARLNAELDTLEKQRLDFQQEHGKSVIRTADGETINSGKLSRLSSTLTEAELNHLNVRLAYETALEIGDNLDRLRIVAASDPVFAKLEVGANRIEPGSPNSIDQVLANLQVLRLSLMEGKGIGIEHPQIREIDKEIAMLETQLRVTGQPVQVELPEAPSTVEQYRALLKQRMETAAAAEREYRGLYDAERTLAIALNSVYAEFENIDRQVERTSRQLEIVDERMRELNLNDDYDVIDVTVLEPAVAGMSPVSPNRSKTMGMALILSLMIGCGLAYLQEMLDDRLRSGEEIASLLGQQILGVIPGMKGTDTSENGQVVDLKPQSVVAEAFRTIRTAIHFNPNGIDVQVLMVTSPSPGDGKSTVASNLAIATASSGKRTLLIDADCRKPRQHRIFGLEPERGLSSLLLEQPQDGRKLESPIVRTSIDKLDLLPCGPVPDNPSELLNSKRFAKIIEKLREHYDKIIIDTPPTVPVSDSRIISSQVDGYALVLRAGKSGRKMARHAGELLGSVGAIPMGLVINGVTNAWGSYAYYSRYGYYQYGYAAYREEETRKPQKLGRGEKAKIDPLVEDEVEAVI